MGDRLSSFGFLSLGFSHIFSASVQTCLIAPDEGRIRSDMVDLVPFIKFHQALIEHLFTADTEDELPFVISGSSPAMVMAVLRSSVMLCRGDLQFSLAPAALSTCSAGFAQTLAEEIMLFLGISGPRLPFIRKDMPFYPPRADRVLNLEGRPDKSVYLCSLTASGAASGHRSEFSFPLLSASDA